MGPPAALLVICLVLAWLVLADREVAVDSGTSQPASQNDQPAHHEDRPLAGRGEGPDARADPMSPQSETDSDDGPATAEQGAIGAGRPVYFANSSEYLETNKHWSKAFAADRLGWVDRLDERFDEPDETATLEGESELARRAVLEHPGYSYTPGITLSSLTAECRNMICKVDVAPAHQHELILDYGSRDPGTGLTPLDEVLFTYNFGHHVTKFSSTTGVLTHYLVINGFDAL